AAAAQGRRFVVALGGDCSALLGCLLGVRKAAQGPVGLLYVDAHTDFARPEQSASGAIAGMSLAVALGRGRPPLTTIGGRRPLVMGTHVALVGRRTDFEDPSAAQASGLLDIPDVELRARAARDLETAIVARVSETKGFWIQMDVDVLNPITMAAVGMR